MGKPRFALRSTVVYNAILDSECVQLAWMQWPFSRRLPWGQALAAGWSVRQGQSTMGLAGIDRTAA